MITAMAVFSGKADANPFENYCSSVLSRCQGYQIDFEGCTESCSSMFSDCVDWCDEVGETPTDWSCHGAPDHYGKCYCSGPCS